MSRHVFKGLGFPRRPSRESGNRTGRRRRGERPAVSYAAASLIIMAAISLRWIWLVPS